MRIAFLAARNLIHTVRWVNALVDKVDEVHLISAHDGGDPLDSKVTFHKLPFSSPHGYILNSYKLKSLLDEIKPDLLNTHYASGYGTLARLTNFSPNILSVWGSDVYDYPEKSFVHKWIIQNNLKEADWVCSTSNVMAEQTKKLFPVDNLSITPFGVDIDKFSPESKNKDNDKIIIGTVKALLPKYGIDVLVRSFAHLKKEITTQYSEKLQLLIVGGGGQELKLKKLVKRLGINGETTFTGRVPHHQVPQYLNKLDIYVALSRLDSESFGVAILEASSCGVPVVVSDVGGLPEVVLDGKTGFVVESESYQVASKKMQELVLDRQMRKEIGESGRDHVVENYRWEACVEKMVMVYRKVLQQNNS